MQKRFIHESYPLQQVEPQQLDLLLGLGFRFLGESFFCYNYAYTDLEWRASYALRLRLADFVFSKSQRKLLRKNTDLRLEIGLYAPSEAKRALFDKHFATLGETETFPIETYVAPEAATIPTQSVERSLYLDDQLLAVSICHHSEKAHNATYCFYDPAFKNRSLGTYTLLLEIQAAIEAGMDFYYLGYAVLDPPQNLYKMNFNNLETLDWETMQWVGIERVRFKK